jgi:hypothetical protein
MTMKKLIYTLLLALPFIGTSCEREAISYGEDEGKLFLTVGIDDYTKVKTRLTDDETSALAADARIRIYDGTTLIRTYQGISSLPSDGLQLLTGDYSVRATAGDSVEASFDKRFYEGNQAFTIKKGEAQNVKVTCKIQNTLVKVNFDDVKSSFEEYELKVGVTSKKSLTFNAETAAADTTGSFILPADSTRLFWTFTGKDQSGNEFTRTGVEEGISIATLYTLTCAFTASTPGDATGGGTLTLSIDSTPLEENVSNVTIYQRPSITGIDAQNNTFSLDSPTFFKPGASGEELSIWIATSSNLEEAWMSCDEFESMGLPASQMNIVTVLKSSEARANLSAAGVSITNRVTIGANNETKCNLGLKFSQALMTKFAAKEGNHQIKFVALDERNNRREATWTIMVSDAAVETVALDETEIWATKATLRAKALSDTSDDLTFNYRLSGSQTWTSVKATKNGDDITAEITGLTPGTRYEYQVVDGGNAAESMKFTTEYALQPENASFENWTDGTPMLIYGSGQSMWWDSGNHGSATMSKNLTTYSEEYVHDGNYSAYLNSQFVGVGSSLGKFAAGNLFTGKYLETLGMSGGAIGWGRPFTSRPTKLTGWVRYVCGTVDYSSSKKISKGDKDKGQIFIALGDWAGTTYSGETWPVVINNTSEDTLFNPNDESIIGYCELTFDDSTSGDGLTEFTLNIDYRSNRKPTAIIIVASSSKYGDYFEGSTGSAMWLDDLKLVYE